jgi:hypothetical protein
VGTRLKSNAEGTAPDARATDAEDDDDDAHVVLSSSLAFRRTPC